MTLYQSNSMAIGAPPMRGFVRWRSKPRGPVTSVSPKAAVPVESAKSVVARSGPRVRIESARFRTAPRSPAKKSSLDTLGSTSSKGLPVLRDFMLRLLSTCLRRV